MTQIIDDLELLLAVLPPTISNKISELDRSASLVEVILDLGRIPMARFVDGEVPLADTELTREDLADAVKRVGDFDADNRSGIERTLHRISAIRNRHGGVVGLTCRVGRAVEGTAEIINDIIGEGRSLLLLGRPGVGKTTILREAARVLAETKRVVIVDTSNEIGGDGDIPHPAVGQARRMQVSNPALQHEVMIEAVENHNPEVIVIDEIGRELEAAAARTIAERGVQLIGTAHGNTLDNIMLNPTLSDLIGGIESVTLSDDEARRRGTQKTVLERRSPPTFDTLVEMQDRQKLAVHSDLASAVDNILRGYDLNYEIRFRNEDGELNIQNAVKPAANRSRRSANGNSTMPWSGGDTADTRPNGRVSPNKATSNGRAAKEAPADVTSVGDPDGTKLQPLYLYAYGLTKQRLEGTARRLGVPLHLVDDVKDAQALATLKSYYRRMQRPVSDAEQLGLPIYVLRSNTSHQMENFLLEVFNVSGNFADDARMAQAIEETRQAIQSVVNGTRTIDLAPQDADIRRIQHKMIRDNALISHSYGKAPRRRVRIFRE